MSPTELATVQAIIDTAVPLLVTAIIGYACKKLVELIPALSGVLTATRIAQAENAVSNIVVARSDDIASGKTTVKQAVEEGVAGLSQSATAALQQQGTTTDQFTARVTGSVITKLATPTKEPNA